MGVPNYDKMFNPILQSLRNLGGSASNSELADEVSRLMGMSEADLAEQHPNGAQTKFEYRLAWARSYLKAYGLITNSERGVWVLTPSGQETVRVDPSEVKRLVRSRRTTSGAAARGKQEAEAPPAESAWREDVLALIFELSPTEFERLCQRILRESGFTQVEVTGRSGDGGIDGVGIVRIGGLLGFPIVFQCKRHQGTVGAGVVRDFRGAMVGRAERGLILTTGLYSRDARAEARRDGAPPVDLVDREALLDKMKEYRLGTQVTQVEQVSVDADWFRIFREHSK